MFLEAASVDCAFGHWPALCSSKRRMTTQTAIGFLVSIFALAGCSSLTRVQTHDGRSLRAVIIDADTTSVTLKTRNRERRGAFDIETVPRSQIKDVSHPGSAQTTAGLVAIAPAAAFVGLGAYAFSQVESTAGLSDDPNILCLVCGTERSRQEVSNDIMKTLGGISLVVGLGATIASVALIGSGQSKKSESRKRFNQGLSGEDLSTNWKPVVHVSPTGDSGYAGVQVAF